MPPRLIDPVKAGLGLRRIAIADHLLEIFEPGGVDDGEPAVAKPRLISAGAEQLLDLGIREFLAAWRDERITHLEPVLPRADDLQLRRDAFDLARPFFDRGSESNIPITLGFWVVDREEADDFGLPVQHETGGVGAREPDPFEARDGSPFRRDVAEQDAPRVLRIAEHEHIRFVGPGFECGAVAIGAKQLAGDAVERARQAQREGRRRGGHFG
jgi:hypothetical protein